jgi:histidyl-tRNA synthetase
VTAGLDALGVAYELDDFLVRGLDYYTRTTFEFASTALQSAQNAVGGGGRYDKLAEALGGPPTPGIGFASGIERVLLALDAEGLLEDGPRPIDCFVVDLTGGEQALLLTTELRRAGLSAERAFDQRSLKAQLRQADRSGACLALIVGSSEVEAETVTARVLRGPLAGTQQELKRGSVATAATELAGKACS